MEYKEYNDLELISYIKEQNEEANEIMYIKYKPLIVSIAKRYYRKSSGLDLNDLINEGMLGVFNAILTYNETLDIPFYSYVKTCIESKIIATFNKNLTLKNKMLNDSVSFDNTNDEYNIENIISEDKNALINLLDKENSIEFDNYLKEVLSDLEYKIFKYRLKGFDYKEISHILNQDIKKIDNALYRIKKKLKDKINN